MSNILVSYNTQDYAAANAAHVTKLAARVAAVQDNLLNKACQIWIAEAQNSISLRTR